MKATDRYTTATPSLVALDKSKIFHHMWHIIRTTRVSKSIALKLAWHKARQKSDKSEKPQGLLATYQGQKLKVNGLTGLRYHFRRNGNLYTAYRMGNTIKITTAQAYRTLQNNRIDARGKDKGHSRYRWA